MKMNQPKTADSAGDDRTLNNQDNTVRHNYRQLTDDEKKQMVLLKDHGLAFIQACRAIGTSRELALAITKAEEAVMWGVKHITQ